MALDQIDVELKRIRFEGQEFIRIVLILNGEEVKGTFDPFEFAVPSLRQANWYLMSCSCGIAGCGGYTHGVNVKRRAHTVEWRDKEKSPTFAKRFYSFDRLAYEAVQEKCMDLMHSVAWEREQTVPVEEIPEGHDVDPMIPWYRVKAFNEGIARYQTYIAENKCSWSW